MTDIEHEVIQVRALRKELNDTITAIHGIGRSRERSLCITKLQEARFWLGMDLKELNKKFPGIAPYTPDDNA